MRKQLCLQFMMGMEVRCCTCIEINMFSLIHPVVAQPIKYFRNEWRFSYLRWKQYFWNLKLLPNIANMCNGFLINNEGLKEDSKLGPLKLYSSALQTEHSGK